MSRKAIMGIEYAAVIGTVLLLLTSPPSGQLPSDASESTPTQPGAPSTTPQPDSQPPTVPAPAPNPCTGVVCTPTTATCPDGTALSCENLCSNGICTQCTLSCYGYRCGNGICDAEESVASCPADCNLCTINSVTCPTTTTCPSGSTVACASGCDPLTGACSTPVCSACPDSTKPAPGPQPTDPFLVQVIDPSGSTTTPPVTTTGSGGTKTYTIATPITGGTVLTLTPLKTNTLAIPFATATGETAELTVTPAQPVAEAKVIAKGLSTNELEELEQLLGAVYNGAELSANFLLKQAVWRFYVSYEWLEEHGIPLDEVRAARLTERGGRVVVAPTTRVTSTVPGSAAYETTVDHLSKWVISGNDLFTGFNICNRNTVCDPPQETSAVCPQDCPPQPPAPTCSTEDMRCSGNAVQVCLSGKWSSPQPCPSGCANGRCIAAPPSSPPLTTVVIGIVAGLIVMALVLAVIFLRK